MYAAAASMKRSSASRARSRAATFSLSRCATSPWPRGSSGTFEDPVAADAIDVLADLQRHAQRLVERRVAVQREQRACPGDRLPHPRELVELALAQLGDRRADPRGDLLGHARQARLDDLGLALGGRVVDPVVEAAALERVVEL